jgi:hypothetical protein
MLQEPRVDTGVLMHLLDSHPRLEGVADVKHPLGVRGGELPLDLIERGLIVRTPQVVSPAPEAKVANLQAADRLLQRFLEGPPDRHRFADRLHLHRQNGVGLGKFFKRPARELRDDIVDRWLEAGQRLAGNVVRDFVEPVAHRQLGGDLGDRETGRL